MSGGSMKTHVLVSVAFVAGAVAALVVVRLMAYIVGGGLGGPQPQRELVQHGVQLVTICDEHHARILDRLSWKIPGVNEGVWGPERKGHCHVWYHYAGSEV
jgi:hypothetical protein